MNPVLTSVDGAAALEPDIVAEAEAILVDALFADMVREFSTVAAAVAAADIESADGDGVDCIHRAGTAGGPDGVRHISVSGRSPPHRRGAKKSEPFD